MRIIAVVMGEPTSKLRNKEISEMFDYSFAQYQIKDLMKNKKSFGKYRVDSGREEYVNVVPKQAVTVLRKKGEQKNAATYDVNINNLKAPLKKGDVVGTIKIKEGGKVIREVELTSDRNVSKINFIELFLRNLRDMITGNVSVN